MSGLRRPALRIPLGIALTLALALGGNILIGKFMNHQHRQDIHAVLVGRLELPLAPENISSIPLYHVHANLWGTLLRERGREGLARIVDRSPDHKKVVLEILPQTILSNGRLLTASDIVFSVQRLINRQNKGHINAKSVIKSTRATSPRTVEIEVYRPTPALSFLLSIPEMGIVPPEACDENGNIVSLAVTSGPYRIESEPTEESVVLLKNDSFADHALNSPKVVKISFQQGAERLSQSSMDDSVDFMEFYDSVGLKVLKSLRDQPNVEVFTTRPSYSIFFVNKSTRMSSESKQALAYLIGEKLDYAFDASTEVRSYELLPPKTFGALGLRSPIERSPELMKHLPKSVSLRMRGGVSPLVESAMRTLENAGIRAEFVTDPSQAADLEGSGQGMNSDFPEIEFFLNMASPYATILASNTEKQLVEDMLHIEDAKDRLESIQKLSRTILDDGRVIPLIVRSYAHLYRKGRIENASELTNYDGDVLFYKMRLAP